MINEAQQPRRSLLHQKQHKLRSQPWLLLSSPLRDSATTRTHCKDHRAETLRRTTSQDKCATVLSCLAILYSVNPEEPSQLPSSTRSWLPATITRRPEIQRRHQEKRERLPDKQQSVLNRGWGENPSPRSRCWTRKGRQAVGLCYPEHKAVTTKINQAIKIQHEQKDVGTEQESVPSGDKESYSHWYSHMHSNIRLFKPWCPQRRIHCHFPVQSSALTDYVFKDWRRFLTSNFHLAASRRTEHREDGSSHFRVGTNT